MAMFKKVFGIIRAIVGWLYWYFYEARVCDHEPSEWIFRDCGMGKIRYCRKCGKTLDLI